MKLIKRQIQIKDGYGMVVVRPETIEDLWYLYNIIANDDRIRCTTVRKVTKETTTGSTSSTKKRLMLTIQITTIDFSIENNDLRISGTVVSENDIVRLGSFHTISIELNQNISVEKDCWDEIYIQYLNDAIHPENEAEMAVIVAQGTGLAHVCLVTGSLTITKAKIDINIPKKRTGSSQHSKATTKFYETIYQAIVRHIDFTKMKCIVIGSPGFIKNDLYNYIIQQASNSTLPNKILLDNKSKFVLVKASSGHKYSISELFNDPTVVAQLNDTKIAQDVVVLQRFLRMLDTDPDRAYYGYNDVCKVQYDGVQAIDILLITDELFRSSDIRTRKQYIVLVEHVRKYNGTVHILSIMHTAGQQLQQISGVAAILRFPVHDIDELEEQYKLATTISTPTTVTNNTTISHYPKDATTTTISNNIDYHTTNVSDNDDDESITGKDKLKQRMMEDVQDMGL